MFLHLYFHNHDIDTRADRRKYKNITNITKGSNAPPKQVMKNLMNVRHNRGNERLMLFGVCNELLLYSLSSNLLGTAKTVAGKNNIILKCYSEI